MSHRRICWSGGFDSTLLVLSALMRGDTVTPILAPMGPEDWQKTRRERAARDYLRVHLPPGLRSRLHPAADITADTHTRQSPLQRDYDHFLDELATRRHDVGLSLQDGYNAQIPMLLAVAQAASPTPQVIEAAFVSTDVSLQDPATFSLLSERIQLPFQHVSKAELLAQHPALYDLLLRTWSCEAHITDGPLQNRLSPCGQCDPCLARIIPAYPLCL